VIFLGKTPGTRVYIYVSCTISVTSWRRAPFRTPPPLSLITDGGHARTASVIHSKKKLISESHFAVVREDPDLSRFGGQPYRTCGSAYVIQKDVIPSCESEQSEEELTLMKMEADLSNKDNVCDPMPPFQTVEQRMLDLTERKLHPFYKRYMAMPKRDREGAEAAKVPYPPYKCKCGPVETDEIPDNLKFNKELLEKKNIFADFKRVELPKQMVVRIVEMEKNRKPTLEKKKK
jgi:hypothetical protein